MAALIAYFVVPYIARYGYSLIAITANTPENGVGLVAAIVVGLVWLMFSLFLRKPKFQQWFILGFFSPIITVPIFYQLTAWISQREQHSYGFGTRESPLWIGLMVTIMLCWLLVPFGLLTAGISGLVAKFVDNLIQNKDSANQPTTRSESKSE